MLKANFESGDMIEFYDDGIFNSIVLFEGESIDPKTDRWNRYITLRATELPKMLILSVDKNSYNHGVGVSVLYNEMVYTIVVLDADSFMRNFRKVA